MTKSSIVGLLVCLMYYVFTCGMAYGQLEGYPTISAAILFSSGFAGTEISIWLLMPFSEEAKRALGFLLGVNGAISGGAWILLVHNSLVFLFFLFGLAQFFYFLCRALQVSKDAIISYDRS